MGGTYSDYNTESDNGFEKLSGSFDIADGVTNAFGLTTVSQNSSLSYSSSGSDGSQTGGNQQNGGQQSGGNTGSSADVWREFGNDSTTFSSEGSISLGPTTSGFGGCYTYAESSNDSASSCPGIGSLRAEPPTANTMRSP